MSLKRAIENFAEGKPVLIFDSEDREGETDIAIPALSVTHRDVAFMRTYGGGLICVAISSESAEKLGLPFIADIYRSVNSSYSLISRIVEREGDVPYDKRSSFSIWVNHRKTFTGVTDIDRALTIRNIGKAVRYVLYGKDYDFASEFRSPGHVAILRAADELVFERKGQTELSIALAEMAGITPAVTICEMLDSTTGKALTREKAREFGKKHGIPFVEGDEIIEGYSELLGKDLSLITK